MSPIPDLMNFLVPQGQGRVDPFAFLRPGNTPPRVNTQGEDLEDEPPEGRLFTEQPPETGTPGQERTTTGDIPPPVTGGEGAGTVEGTTGEWNTYLTDPANRAFLLGAGLQLMTGGWGGIGEQLARGLGAGFQSASATERGARVEETAPGTGRGRGRRRTGRGLGVDDTGAGAGPGARGGSGLVNIRRRSQLAEAEELINSNPDEATWTAANQPGGIIHTVFGGARDYNTRDTLLHQVQDERTRTPQTDPTTMEEWIALGSSRDPAAQARFDQWARTPRSRGGGNFGAPGQGFRWGVDPTTGQVTRIPFAGEGGPGGRGTGGPGGRGTAFSQAAQGGVDAARLTIENVRDWLSSSIGASDPTGITGQISRGVQQGTGVGSYAAIMGSMRDGVMSYVHARSGAQVSVREFEHYLETRMPAPGDSEGRIRYKLADLELALLLIARRRGEPVTEEQLFNLYNLGRRYVDLTPVTAEEFTRRLPHIEAERGVRPGAAGTTPGPGVTPGPGQRQPPSLPDRPDGTRIQGPDGTVWLRRGGRWEAEGR